MSLTLLVHLYLPLALQIWHIQVQWHTPRLFAQTQQFPLSSWSYFRDNSCKLHPWEAVSLQLLVVMYFLQFLIQILSMPGLLKETFASVKDAEVVSGIRMARYLLHHLISVLPEQNGAHSGTLITPRGSLSLKSLLCSSCISWFHFL